MLRHYIVEGIMRHNRVCKSEFSCRSSKANLEDLPKDYMLAIQMWCLGSGDEKLAPICTRTSVGHGKQMLAIMLQLKVFIFKLLPVD